MLGEFNRLASVNRLGNADMGVSPGPDVGGGRAKGLTGPVCPADSSPTDGDGGGRTTEWFDSGFPGPEVTTVVVLGEVLAVSAPSSDCSLGIVTLSRGRFPGGGTGMVGAVPTLGVRSPMIGAGGG